MHLPFTLLMKEYNPLELREQDFLGLRKEEAMRRAQEMGAAFFFVECHGKKGPIEGADCQRVMRMRQVEAGWEMLLSSFRCDI